MSPATISNPAWLAVTPADSLPEQVAAQIGPVAHKIGFVPNVARLLAISPDHFTGWWGYFDEQDLSGGGLTHGIGMPGIGVPAKLRFSMRQSGFTQRAAAEGAFARQTGRRDRDEEDDHRHRSLRVGAGRTSPVRADDTRGRHEEMPPDDEQVPGNVRPAGRFSGGHGVHERGHSGPGAGSGR